MPAADRLDTDAFARLLEDASTVIVDARPIAAYNGWRLRGEARGGHVPSARSLPVAWARYMDWVEALDEKGIHRDRHVVVYGYDDEDAGQLVRRLEGLGFERVSVYTDFIAGWAADPERPLEQLARFGQLVHPQWLSKLLSGREVDEHDGRDHVLCHVHFDNYDDYHRGHIPGAIALDTLLLEDETTWNRRTPEELRQNLTRLGIRYDQTVIVYGRFSHPRFEDEHPGKQAGQLGAMRAAAILLYAGVEDVRILNGGLTAWKDAGMPIDTDVIEPTPVDDFGAEIPSRPEFFIDTPEAKEYLATPDALLVSVRSRPEHIGETSGYHYIEQKGRIPGAVFGNGGSDAYHMENYRNFDFTMRAYPEVEAAWRSIGVVPEKRAAFYCGTGWRGSEAFLNAYLMGWPHVAVYDGGWMEWSADPANPTETGVPSDEVDSMDRSRT